MFETFTPKIVNVIRVVCGGNDNRTYFFYYFPINKPTIFFTSILSVNVESCTIILTQGLIARMTFNIYIIDILCMCQHNVAD